VEIRGGYPVTATSATTDADRNWAANQAILSGDIDDNDTGDTINGDNAYHVVLGVDIATGSGTVLDGFTIKGGNADGSGSINVDMGQGSRSISGANGAGLFNFYSSPVLTNVTIAGNTVSFMGGGDGGGMYNTDSSSPVLTNVTIAGNIAPIGGGMSNNSSSPILTNVTIAGNSASPFSSSGNGGGMSNNSSSPVLTNVIITGNSASPHGMGSSYGGGMYNTGSSSPVLTNVTISGNVASLGGGMSNNSSSPILTNVTIAGNSANTYGGGGMYNSSSSPVLTNVTITGNKVSSFGSGGGMYNNSSSPKIRNSVIWGNTATGEPGISNNDSVNTPTVDYSIVQGGWTGAGGNNLNSDPLFVSAATDPAPTTTGNYHLTADSPAINAGSNGYYPDTLAKWQAIETLLGQTILTEAVYNAYVLPALSKDAGGADRIKGTVIDMGAYEEPGGVTPPFRRYVKANGTGDGSSWENASADLQAMIDAASAAGGGIVRVAAGTYKPKYAPSSTGASVPDADLSANGRTARDKTFILRQGVEIRGGYPDTATSATTDANRDWVANMVILSGDLNGDDSGTSNKTDNVYHVVLGMGIANDGMTILDGLEIRGGYSSTSDGGSITIGSSHEIYKSYGGGMFNSNSSPVLTNVTISDNSASSGGGIYNYYQCSLVLTNVVISGNTASGTSGGGIVNYSSSPVLTNVIITGNFVSGISAVGGGMYNYNSSSPVLTNVTIAGNRVQSGNGSGMYNNSSSSPQIRNSIIWGNDANTGAGIYNVSSSPTINYSIVQGGWSGAGGNNLNTDPLFVSEENASNAPTTTGDYRLTADSPAINAGSNGYYGSSQTPNLSAITTDLDGTARIKGGTIDMGAYEKE
jgi:hypothetical protein